ncbi:MAG: Tn3 family transposase, partial [Saprospiraceae bacterium]
GRNTLKQMRLWAQRLDWLYTIIQPTDFIEHIKYTKLRQFASQAKQLEVGDIKDISNPAKRYTFLLCFLHEAQTKTRDELINMFLKRMRQTHNRAKEQLEKMKSEYRVWEEQMMETLNQVVDSAAKESKNSLLGKRVRNILEEYGGADTISKRYKIVSAYHGNNHLPLLWNKHKAHRKAIYQLLSLLEIKSANEDTNLLAAFKFIKEHQNTRRDYLPKSIKLDFLSNRWKAYVQTKHEGKTVLKRRELEVCILSYFADAIRCGDLYATGSEEFTDFRAQLLPWEECLTYLDEYCEGVGLPNTADDFVAQLQQRLKKACQQTDDSFPENTHFTIDEFGQPHLKRLRAKEKPEGLKEFQKKMRALMPERHLLDMLKNVEHWSNYTKHFSPPSGSKTKMKDAISRYIFTVFSYGCNLGATQTAKHIKGDITARILKRINHQHITPEKLQEASTDIINHYARFDLPFLWGTGKSSAADGTHIQLIQNNLIGEQHIRYGGYGGIAYHHISDTYVALFCNFIACGVWEAVYILDGLMKNTSKLQPDTVHADTQGQSEPVFGLSYLLGIQLMPTMRNWNDVTFYKADKDDSYQHIDELFSDTIDWDLIRTHWKDLMQVVISINQGKVLPSMLLQKLGTNSRKNKLNKAFRELGRVIRTIFLLEYVNSEEMRRKIRATSNKVESFHFFHDWITFGGFIITTGDPVEQHKRNKYIDLVANAIMLHNVADMTKIIDELVKNGEEVTPELLSFLSPYLTEHIKRFGQYLLDTGEVPEPLELLKLFFLEK